MFQRFVNWFVRHIGIDRLLHFLVCAVVVFSLTQFAPAWVGVLVASVLGVAKEIYDKKFSTGADLMDFVADVLGILYAYILIIC